MKIPFCIICALAYIAFYLFARCYCIIKDKFDF